MYHYIIFNNNIETIKNIINLFSEFSNFKICGITNSKSELALLSEKSQPYLIIISDSDSKKIEMSKILNNYKYKIIICDNILEFKNSKYTLHISLKLSEKEIIKKLKPFLSNLDERAIRKKVNNILHKLNFDFKLNGTKYLLESIVYSYLNKENYLFENLEKKIFPHIAKKFGVSSNNVKFSIIRSINNMNSNLQKSNPQQIIFPDKITSKVLINEIVNRL